MSQENLEVVRRVTDVMDAEGFEAASSYWSVGSGRGKASGAQGEISMAMVWTVREQAITRVEFFLDRAQALEAVGLRE